jgi:hypothetical protein
MVKLKKKTHRLEKKTNEGKTNTIQVNRIVRRGTILES